jgi:hypothetical protein
VVFPLVQRFIRNNVIAGATVPIQPRPSSRRSRPGVRAAAPTGS